MNQRTNHCELSTTQNATLFAISKGTTEVASYATWNSCRADILHLFICARNESGVYYVNTREYIRQCFSPTPLETILMRADKSKTGTQPYLH